MLRKVSAIFVLLAFAVFLLFAGNGMAQDSNDVHLPIAFGGEGSIVSAVVITTPEDILGGIPLPPLSDNPLEEARAMAREMAKSPEIRADGLSTAGSVITVMKNPVRLPDNVFVEAYVVSGDCLVGAACPETPIYVLKETNSDAIISVSAASGEVIDYVTTDHEVAEANRQSFSWLISAVEEKPVQAAQIQATPTGYPRPHYLDVDKQLPTPSGVDHYTFQPMYLNAMFDAEDPPYVIKRIRWWSKQASLRTDVLNAIANWNSVKPSSAILDVTEALYDGLEHITFNLQSCPISDNNDFVGCFRVNTWQGISWNGTTPVNSWTKANIYIRPTTSTYVYVSTARQTVAAHEFGHALGLNDQVLGSPGSAYCNSSMTTVMDGFYANNIGGVDYIYPCDSYALTSTDQGMWRNYQNRGSYGWYTYYNFPDGKSSTSWYDYVPNDWMQETKWKWSNSSSGPWTTFATINSIGDNGSMAYVPGAGSLRVIASLYPGSYGVHSKYLQVCARGVINWFEKSDTEICGPAFWFPY